MGAGVGGRSGFGEGAARQHLGMDFPLVSTRAAVSYTIGLGDRHLNNILIDWDTAELIHIDLGMIFDYSRRVLRIPETVPFRLTRDLVDPLLVDGVHGLFRHVAEHCLAQLRAHANVLVGLASMVLSDPISSFDVGHAQGYNSLAENAISRLKAKLSGRDRDCVPVSTEEHVLRLINEASDPVNLSRMFAGWMPFI